MPANEALRTCLDVVRVLELLDIPYVVGGSLASSLHGIPRSTNDADLPVELGQETVRPLVEALGGRYYVDEERARDAVRRRASPGGAASDLAGCKTAGTFSGSSARPARSRRSARSTMSLRNLSRTS